jgi:PAS domain S-box-containing protein
MIRRVIALKPPVVLAIAAAMIAAIAIADWQVEFNATLGFLYIFPLALLGSALNGWQLAIAAAFCTFLSDRLDPFPGDTEEARDALIFLTLATTGLLSWGMSRSYRREIQSMAAIQAAEQQLDFLIESSPAAVLTMDSAGVILLANPAAHRLLDVPEGALPGRSIARYIPALGSVPASGEASRVFRTEMQTRGQRESGETFLANVFFSTYSTPAGPRLAALLVDISEELREREESSLHQLLAGSRILVAAVSHEVRNVCGAIAMMHENLTRQGALEGNQDFMALGSLVETLSTIASVELKQTASKSESQSVDLDDVLDDLHIVLEQYCQESDIELRWLVPRGLPVVEADRASLLQVLLNLTKNSQRALEKVDDRFIEVSAETSCNASSEAATRSVIIHFCDSGPGIPPGQKLFQPLQKDADATGLGLYLSRAFMRSFHGDLRHHPDHGGCCFVLDLQLATADPQEQS